MSLIAIPLLPARDPGLRQLIEGKRTKPRPIALWDQPMPRATGGVPLPRRLVPGGATSPVPVVATPPRPRRSSQSGSTIRRSTSSLSSSQAEGPLYHCDEHVAVGRIRITPTLDLPPITALPAAAPEIWYVFPGIGCQWQGMGKAMLTVPTFRNAVAECSEMLKPFGLDLLGKMEREDACFVTDTTYGAAGIVAIEIALVDTLKNDGIRPAGFVGHSFGEVACGYADGKLTKAEAMKTIYMMAKLTGKFRGKMAAVELPWHEVVNLAPEGVHAVCHNGPTSTTVAGDANAVVNWITELKQRGQLATVIESTNIAFHVPKMGQIKSRVVKSVARAIPGKPRRRSAMWVSSSRQDGPLEQDRTPCSAEYFAHNLTSPVSFSEALDKVPAGAIVLELGPHSILKRIVEQGTDCSAVHVAASKRGSHNNIASLLETLRAAVGATPAAPKRGKQGSKADAPKMTAVGACGLHVLHVPAPTAIGKMMNHGLTRPSSLSRFADFTGVISSVLRFRHGSC